jgi:hypothetical protein
VFLADCSTANDAAEARRVSEARSGNALDAWLRAIADQRSHDEYENRMKLYVRPTFDRTPLVKVTKAKLIELRNALKSSDDPISNATINTLFASLSSAYSYFVEQGWCSQLGEISGCPETAPLRRQRNT